MRFVGRFIKIDEISVVMWKDDHQAIFNESEDVFLVIEKGKYYYRCLSRLGCIELDNLEVDRFGYTVD